MRTLWGLFIWVGLGTSALATQLVAEGTDVKCTLYPLYHELVIYKDPSLFVTHLNLIYLDPATGWKELMNESPLLTKVKGQVAFEEPAKPRKFENFGEIARLYEAADPRFRISKRIGHSYEKAADHPDIIPVKICGGVSDAYKDTIGFVLAEDLKAAQKNDIVRNGLPPSVYPNPVPTLPRP